MSSSITPLIGVRAPWSLDPEGAWPAADAAAWRATWAKQVQALHGTLAADDGETFLARIPDLAAALDLGLALLPRSAVVALGHGLCRTTEGRLLGPEPSRVRAILWRAPPGTFHCTDASRRALEVPAGVGVHQAGGLAAARVGLPLHQVTDYRGGRARGEPVG